ncbi:MAG: hypothetical protein HDR98_05335 [Bacteroides sp.]|nr:hypothetical protein [Bacteroides sp.]
MIISDCPVEESFHEQGVGAVRGVVLHGDVEQGVGWRGEIELVMRLCVENGVQWSVGTAQTRGVDASEQAVGRVRGRLHEAVGLGQYFRCMRVMACCQ